MHSFLIQASIYLAAAVIAVPIAARLGLGSVLGYLAAGVLIGPVFGLVGAEAQELQHFAEFGVVMMLFLIGLELDPRALWAMRDKLIGLGGLQIGITTLAIGTGALFLGLVPASALAIGMIFALSSTAIVLQTLSEKGLMQTPGGRSVFAVLLTQDIAVIPMLALLPLLAVHAPAAIAPDGSLTRPALDAGAGLSHSLSLVEGLSGWQVTLITLAMVAAVILAGVFLTRPLFHFIIAARLREMYTALALLIVVGIAFLMMLVGLSPALGTFLAGVVLANSEFRHELESDLQPFKGLLLGLFFITVGAGIRFDILLGDPVGIVALTVAVIAVKGLILYPLGRAFGLRGRHKWLFTLSLAQAGEFGFVLIAFSRQQGVLTQTHSDLMLLVVALSMLITPLLFILYEWLSRGQKDHKTAYPEDEIDETGPIIIAGIGRFGQIVNRLVRASGFSTVVLDNDMPTIRLMRQFGVKSFFGDPTRPELLHAAGLARAQVLVVAVDDISAANRLVRFARRERPDLRIIVRAHDRAHVFQLFKAGADDIIRETFDSSLRAGRYVLENAGLNEWEAAEAERTFYHHDREALRELAELWDPNLPAADNAPYIARARELEKELELQLLARRQSSDSPP